VVWRLRSALLLVYVVWGTTYFAMGIALETMPPLLMNASRFLCAGVVMLLVALAQGQRTAHGAQWRNSALVGGLMVFLAMNCIGFAQKMGIGSGLMATVVTTMPMWLALWTRWGGERVPLTSWIGLGLGVAGALLLALEGDFSATWLGALLAFGAPLCWSLGSYASRKSDLPGPAMASAAAVACGWRDGLAVALWWSRWPCWRNASAASWDGVDLSAGVWHAGCTQCLPVAAAKHHGRAGGQLFVCEPGRGPVGGRAGIGHESA
jgi:drug/metabolite transporter (DMT)-like permease